MGLKWSIELAPIEKIFNVSCQQTLIKVGDTVYEEFKDLLSGKLTLALLKKLDHPFATRHHLLLSALPIKTVAQNIYGKRFKGVPLYIINEQTGRLLRSLKKGKIERNSKGEFFISIYIDSLETEYAEYVFFGTSKMIPRPLHITYALNNRERISRIARNLFATIFVKNLRRFRRKIIGRNRI